MIRIKEAIVVEGRYDKNTLSQIVDAVILETSGFGVFKDEEKLSLLRRIAEKQGLIVFTDSDGAGFVIRNYIKGAIPPHLVKHAYIPDVYGKERRKRAPGKEGKLGVEGMTPDIILQALLRAGATVEGKVVSVPRGEITPADLFLMGLTGHEDSAQLRARLLHRLELPQHMSAKAMLTVLNALYTRSELIDLMEEI